MEITVHMTINVRGVLRWKDKNLVKLFKQPNGKKADAGEVRNYLYDKLKEGYEVLPYGKECEGFDKKTGCPGHEVSKT